MLKTNISEDLKNSIVTYYFNGDNLEIITDLQEKLKLELESLSEDLGIVVKTYETIAKQNSIKNQIKELESLKG